MFMLMSPAAEFLIDTLVETENRTLQLEARLKYLKNMSFMD